VLVEEDFEPGVGWLIYDILSQCPPEGANVPAREGTSEAFQDRRPRANYRSSADSAEVGGV
jgi:hypothetical protein